MHVTVRCPGCHGALPLNAADATQEIRCGACGREISLELSDAVRRDEAVDQCPQCRGRDFYIRKDFDQRLGLAVIIGGILISALVYWVGLDLIAYLVLAAMTLIDLFIYWRIGTVTVCYRCQTEFRGNYPRTAPAFDLHTADLLEPEWERKIGRR